MLVEFEGKRPQVHPEAFVAANATLIGDVVVERGASIWYGVVLRADECSIVVREDANVQDNSVVHGRPGETIEIGPGATVAHSCVVHGGTLGRHALLGNASSMMDGSSIGEGAMVAAGSMVGADRHIADGSLAVGTPAKERGLVADSPGAQYFVELNPIYYADLGRRHRLGTTVIDD